MIVKKTVLQDALAIVKPGLANKEVIEQSTSFAFIDGRVVTYNDDISLSHPVEGLELEGAIESDRLYQLLTKIKKEEIDIQIEGNEILITAGKTKAGLTLQNEVKLPLDEELGKKGKFKEIPENFLKYLAFCIPCCSNQKVNPLLHSVHVSQEGVIEASDNYRLTQCLLTEEMPVQDFLLPVESAKLVVRMAPNQIAEGKGWVHFKTEEGTVLSCRILESDKYPETAPHLIAKKAKKVMFPDSIIESMERAGIFKDSDGDGTIDVALNSNKLTISSTVALSWFSEDVKVKYEDEPISFKVNPDLLKGILNETTAAEISANKLFFRGEGWTFMTVLK